MSSHEIDDMQWSQVVRSSAFRITVAGGILATVIGGLIVEDRADIWAAIKWLAIGSWGAVSAGAKLSGQWLTDPVTIPHSHFISWIALAFLLGAAVCATVFGVAFRYVPSWRRLVVPRPQTPSFDAADSRTLTDEDRAILKLVAGCDGQLVPVGLIRTRLGWANLIAQRHLERLILAGLLEDGRAKTGPSMNTIPAVRLTRKGIDLAIRSDWIPAG